MRFSKIKNNDIVNGIGITLSVWTQGCPHRCKGCFNKETWTFNEGNEFTNDDLNYIISNIDSFNVKRNLSVLGGEPLCPENVEGVINLCREFKKVYPNKLIYLWTGYTIEEFNQRQKQILEYVDFIIDGKFEEAKKNLNLKLRGSSNQRILDVKNNKFIYHIDNRIN